MKKTLTLCDICEREITHTESLFRAYVSVTPHVTLAGTDLVELKKELQEVCTDCVRRIVAAFKRPVPYTPASHFDAIVEAARKRKEEKPFITLGVEPLPPVCDQTVPPLTVRDTLVESKGLTNEVQADCRQPVGEAAPHKL